MRNVITVDWRGPLLVGVLVAIGAGVGIAAQSPSDDDTVDKASYAAGWQYVVQRQPRSGILLGPNLDQPVGPAPDEVIVGNCRVYGDGYAQLDGVTDTAAFLAGCDDAAAMTRLEQP